MPVQPVSRKRCASCNRWDGQRAPGETPDTVVVADENAGGRCIGGPWEGELRRARAACGRWTVWTVLSTTDETGENGDNHSTS